MLEWLSSRCRSSSSNHPAIFVSGLRRIMLPLRNYGSAITRKAQGIRASPGRSPSIKRFASVGLMGGERKERRDKTQAAGEAHRRIRAGTKSRVAGSCSFREQASSRQCKSVASVSSVLYALATRFFGTHRPLIKRIRRICTDSWPI